jgi:hypothetical protein
MLPQPSTRTLSTRLPSTLLASSKVNTLLVNIMRHTRISTPRDSTRLPNNSHMELRRTMITPHRNPRVTNPRLSSRPNSERRLRLSEVDVEVRY